jgi:putative glutamine amidotransferase
MKRRPLILVTPTTQLAGAELADPSISVSEEYLRALIAAGGTPLVMSCTADRAYVASVVAACDGVLLTGGEDIAPALHSPDAPAGLRAKVKRTEPDRDRVELLLIREIFRQRRPLFAICRGHQMLNVVFGGTLLLDIPSQRPGPIRHRQMDRKAEPVHEVQVIRGSLLARLLGRTRIGVNSTHHQAVDRVAASFVVTARSEDGIVEAMELGPEAATRLPWCLSVQFHPERLGGCDPGFPRLFRAFVKACAADGAARRY